MLKAIGASWLMGNERWLALAGTKTHSPCFKDMKTELKSLMAAALAGLLLTGCCSTYVTRWEYKVAAAPHWQTGMSPSQLHESQQAFLNGLGKDGWVLVSQDEGGVYYLKRPLR
jgi:hypothetical protein